MCTFNNCSNRRRIAVYVFSSESRWLSAMSIRVDMLIVRHCNCHLVIVRHDMCHRVSVMMLYCAILAHSTRRQTSHLLWRSAKLVKQGCTLMLYDTIYCPFCSSYVTLIIVCNSNPFVAFNCNTIYPWNDYILGSKHKGNKQRKKYLQIAKQNICKEKVWGLTTKLNNSH